MKIYQFLDISILTKTFRLSWKHRWKLLDPEKVSHWKFQVSNTQPCPFSLKMLVSLNKLYFLPINSTSTINNYSFKTSSRWQRLQKRRNFWRFISVWWNWMARTRMGMVVDCTRYSTLWSIKLCFPLYILNSISISF